MILFNLPQTWILVCGKHKRPWEIKIATYKILNRTELCKCCSTAGTFSLDETLIQCTPEVHKEADRVFKMSYAINKIFFDYLQVNKNVILEGEVFRLFLSCYHKNHNMTSHQSNGMKVQGSQIM